MSTEAPARPSSEIDSEIPPLSAGDRLSLEEFERRYNAMPGIKAELIEGVVYVASPVSSGDHGVPHFSAIGWMSLYQIRTPGVEGGDNSTIKLDPRNMPQPDAYLRILPEFGGQSGNTTDGKYIHGAPEFVAEIAATSANYDLYDKFHSYERNGVREYFVWRVWDREIDWFILRNGRFERKSAGTDGIFRSEVLPGLWLDYAALIAGNMLRVSDVALAGTQSPEHAAFVEKLTSHRRAT
ncbi:MAG: Uma2 family endonuclease [Planctomycetaceae bacterium]|nr:Uma2 family endonuclease [Planctomycetaceae bacterium]